MKATINPQRTLVATAWLRGDGMVIYSQEGTPIQDQPLRLRELRGQLSGNLAFPENIEKFCDDLLASGFAEIRQPKPMMKPFVG